MGERVVLSRVLMGGIWSGEREKLEKVRNTELAWEVICHQYSKRQYTHIVTVAASSFGSHHHHQLHYILRARKARFQTYSYRTTSTTCVRIIQTTRRGGLQTALAGAQEHVHARLVAKHRASISHSGPLSRQQIYSSTLPVQRVPVWWRVLGHDEGLHFVEGCHGDVLQDLWGECILEWG